MTAVKGTAFGPSAVLLLVACSSQPPPGGSGADCTYLRTDLTPSAGADGGTGKVVFSPDAGLGCSGALCVYNCWPPAGFRLDGGATTCTVLVAVPGASDESVCATYGYDVPEPAVLRQAQAEDDASPPSAVCLVPQVDPALLDAGGGCVAAGAPAWCVASGMGVQDATGCNQLLVFSNPTLRLGFRYTLRCWQGC